MTIRSVRAFALAVPMSGALMLAVAAPALAAPPAAGSLVLDLSVAQSSNPTATVGAAPRSCPLVGACKPDGTLTITRPDGAKVLPDGSKSGTVTVTNGSGTTPYTVQASQVRGTVRNGTWKVTLADYGGSTEKTFIADFAPAAPTNVSAVAMSQSEIDITWKRGSEPDLTGFVVDDGAGNTRSVDTSVCDSQAGGATCRLANTYQNGTPGTYNYSFTVVALRTSGQAGHADLSSGRSGAASAQLVTPQPPPPDPTPSPSPASGGTGGGSTGGTSGAPTGSGTTGGSSSGTTSGGTVHGSTGGLTSGGTHTSGGTVAGKPLVIPQLPAVAAQRKAFALSFNHFSPSLGIPKLPPLPATTFRVATVTDGGYQPVLPYSAQAQKSTTTTTTSVLAPLAAVTNLDTAQLARILAFSLILLVAAGHVRAFLVSHRED